MKEEIEPERESERKRERRLRYGAAFLACYKKERRVCEVCDDMSKSKDQAKRKEMKRSVFREPFKT